MGILPGFPKPRQHSSPVPECKASQSLGSLVPNWKMSGTEHPLAVSETRCCFSAYLQGVGSLLGFDFSRPPSPRGGQNRTRAASLHLEDKIGRAHVLTPVTQSFPIAASSC